MVPENPSATWERGQRVEVHWTKNNHLDGFMRLALVPLDEMWSKEAHQRYSFYWGCWSDQIFECNDYERHRDCYYDRDNLAYKTQITVPTVYPDGVYVLGYIWYGGGKDFGSFGEYWDCAYVHIKGGPQESTYPATFESWNGWCMSSVDRIGVCETEPCQGEHWSRRRIPVEFRNGAPTLYKQWYDDAMNRGANQIAVAEPTDFGITGFKIIDTKHESQMDVNQDWVIELDQPVTITILPETFGNINVIQWFVNGEKVQDAYSYPWAVSGQQPNGNGGWNYYDWSYPVLDKRVFVTAVAWNGDRRAYYSKDLVFLPKRR